MNIEKIEFKKEREQKNGEKLLISLKGKIPAIDKVPTLKILESFITDNHISENMVANKRFLEIATSSCIEKELEISYQNKSKIQEKVKFVDGLLKAYYYENQENGLKIAYDETSKLNISASLIEVLEKDSQIRLELEYLLSKLTRLNEMETQIISADERRISAIYKVFYNKKADFNEPDIELKIQTMIYILTSFGILPIKYNFGREQDFEFPSSTYIKELTQKLRPYGNLGDCEILDQKTKKRITVIGQIIRENAKNEIELQQNLLQISNLIYDKGISNKTSIQELSTISSFSDENSLKLIKTLIEKNATLKDEN